MAYRPVYMVRETYPYFDTFEVEFTWNGGFAVSQKQKNIAAIHAAYEAAYPGHHALEISGKSPLEGGRNLSAFFLPIYVPELGEKRSGGKCLSGRQGICIRRPLHGPIYLHAKGSQARHAVKGIRSTDRISDCRTGVSNGTEDSVL